MQPLLAVIRKEFLAMTRDVHGLLVLFVMPSVFILVMSLALRDTFQPSLSEKASWQVWDGDGTPSAAAFLARLPAPTARAGVRNPAELEQALARGDVRLGLVIAPGFAEELAASAPSRPVVTVLAEPGLPPALIAAFRAEVFQAMMAERVQVLFEPLRAMAEEAGETLPAAEQMTPETLVEFKFHRDAQVPLTAVQQSVPAWLVFAMFFVVIPLSTIFIAEKQLGTLPRLRSLQVPVATLLGGKVIPFYFVNLGQTGLMLLVGRFIVPLCGGDALRLELDWLALWAMASAVSLAAIGFALAVAALVRTTEQATTIGGLANILFGALGGVMVPKLVMPSGMQQATWFSPMAWGLEGFLAVFVRHAHIAQLGLELGLLLGFAALGLTVAWWRLRSPE